MEQEQYEFEMNCAGEAEAEAMVAQAEAEVEIETQKDVKKVEDEVIDEGEEAYKEHLAISSSTV